ncbi:SoxR reducing system RseC family protein [Sinimarinibacterium thermocellulolyticum]|uniref:SoxR reducing system RseC family protein n=1 Tax=Sinimarinibacterium thermocellulolyticum TaxID=3170016 RepID=A0ABV2AAY3_9GAMM
MIEERAIVARVDDQGSVWVRPYGVESCPKCARGEGCGGGVLARLLGRRRPEIRVGGRLDGLRAGDAVVVGVEESALMLASLWVYLVPLAGMFLAGAFAHLALKAHDVLVAAFGLTGLVGGFVLTHWAGRRAETVSRYLPVLVRRLPEARADCPRAG